MGSRTLELSRPGGSPVGMWPDRDPAGLGPGQARELTNLRCRAGALVVRPGSTRLADPPVSGVEYRGAWHGVLEGERKTFVAFRIPGSPVKTRVYELSGTTYAEITDTDSRFAAEGRVSFAAVRDTDPANASDLLVMGNGTDENRVFAAAGGSYLEAGIGLNRSLPKAASVRSVGGPAAWWSLATLGSSTDETSVSSAILDGQPNLVLIGGTNPDGVVAEYTFTAADPDGGSSLNLDGGLFLQWTDENDDSADTDGTVGLFDYVAKLEVFGTVEGVAGWHELAMGPIQTVSVAAATASVGGLARRRALVDGEGLGMTGATKLRLTFAATGDLPADLVTTFEAVAATGPIRGDALHAVAMASRLGRGESPAVPAEASGKRVAVFAIGGTGVGNWPIENGIGSRFDVLVKAGLVPLTGLHAVLYRSEATESGFGPFYRTKISETGTDHAPADAYLVASPGTDFQIRDRGDSPNDSDFEAPDVLYLVTQPSASLSTDASRLFACDSAGLWCGDARYPLRFRRLPRTAEGGLDDSSATLLTFAGEEARAVRGLGAPTGANGLSPLVLLTDRSAYRVAGDSTTELSRPQRIAGSRGVVSSRATLVEGGALYWLDPEGRLNSTDLAGAADLSTGSVREWTLARLDPASAYLDAWAGLVRCKLSGDATLVFDPGPGGFGVDSGTAYAGTLNTLDRWLGWDSEGALWHLEDPAARGDGIAPIDVAVEFREIAGPEPGRSTFGRVGLWTSGGGPSDWTVRWEEPNFGEMRSASMPSEIGNPGVVRWTAPSGVAGHSVRVRVSGAFESGVTLRGVYLEVDGSAGRRA